MKLFVCTFALAAAFGVQTFAQQMPTDDPVATAPVKFGALALGPRLSVSNVGIDSNVFNEASDPKSDFTITVSPSTNVWLRTQRGLLSINGALDAVHFNQYSSESSINSRATGQYEYRFNRLRPFVNARTLNTRERPGYEIDVRARRYETEFGGGVDSRVMSKGTLGVAYRHTQYTFDGDAVFNGRPLNDTLSRTLKSAEVNWRHRLTTQTTWLVRGLREQQRFENEPRRNSNGARFKAGFELGQFALIRGTAIVGFLNLAPSDGASFEKYSGATADVDVAYTAPTRTRLGLGVDRDVQYSSDFLEVYYLQTGWTATITQRLIGRWDLQLQGGQDRLNFEGIAARAGGDRVDTVDRFGGGIGFEIRPGTRISFDVRALQRDSPDRFRDYNTLRAGLSVNYGL